MAERQLIDERSVPSLPTFPSNRSTTQSQSTNSDLVGNVGDQSPDGDQNKPIDGITSGMSKLDASSESILFEDIPDCAVCLQTCIHPVRLPCSHVFCFLCVKGVAMQSGRCALCRKQITADFFSNPTVLRGEIEVEEAEEPVRADKYTWYYEGRNGWWQYEERTNQELEESYCKKLRTFELLIAGFVYTIDLDNMVQMRRSDPSRRRRIKRDLSSAPRKGIAGLKIAQQQMGEAANSEANREVLGSECEKDSQATGGNVSPVDDATQTPADDNLGEANQEGASLNPEQRTSPTDDTAYEVLPQPQVSADNRDESLAHSKSSRNNGANNQKKAKSRPQMRETVPRHPTSHARTTSVNNDSYSLVVHHQRSHSSPVATSVSASHSEVEQQGAVSRVPTSRALSPDDVDLDLNVEGTSRPRRGDSTQTDNAQSCRQLRNRRRKQQSSDV